LKSKIASQISWIVTDAKYFSAHAQFNVLCLVSQPADGLVCDVNSVSDYFTIPFHW